MITVRRGPAPHRAPAGAAIFVLASLAGSRPDLERHLSRRPFGEALPAGATEATVRMDAALGLIRDGLVFGAVYPAVLATVVLAVWLALGPVRRPVLARVHRYGGPVLTGVAVVGLVLYVSVVGWYTTLPTFAEEVEPNIATVSWMLQQGEPLYHAFDSAERYSVLYGPTVYLTNGWVLDWLGPSIPAAKLASAVASVVSLLMLFLAVRRRGGDRVALIVAGLAALLYAAVGPHSYVGRPDGLLLFCTAFGLACAVLDRRWLAAAGVATALGFAVNLKIHAVIFFLPHLFLLARAHGRRSVVAALAGAVVLAAIPFVAHPQVSLANYVVWLREAMRHGLEGFELPRTIGMGLFLVVPAVVIAMRVGRLRPGLGPRRSLALVLSAVAVLLTVISCKPGAGRAHVMPLVPITLYALADLLLALRRDQTSWAPVFPWRRAGLATAFVVAALAAGSIVQYRTVRTVRAQTAPAAAWQADVMTVLDRYGDLRIGMGYGGEGTSFLKTSLRPLLAFAGHRPLIDVIAVMEAERSGRTIPDATLGALRRGDVDLWLVPRDRAPFDKRNWYPPHRPVFTAEFVDVFMEHHIRFERMHHFDLWIHRSHREYVRPTS